MDPRSRTAIVTGAAQGLGRAIAEQLYQAGVERVIAADLNSEGVEDAARDIDPIGDRVLPATVDVRDRASIVNLIENTIERCGTVDILVNNAARTVMVPLWEIDDQEWDDVLASNLRSVFITSQLLGAHMRANGWGRIINLSSLAGQQAGGAAGAHYATSKAGVIILTKMFALELAGSGVTVNAIAPAAIRSPIADSFSAEKLAQLESRIPVGRLGTPEEVGHLAVYLASDAAAFVTGATIEVNGGLFMR